jgi:hypothetical protein
MTSLSNIRPVAPAPLRPSDGFVRSLIADELDRISAALEDMGVQLCCDPQIVLGHLAMLQTIDELCQRNENLARTLRADDMVAESASITLDSLRTRLQSAVVERLGECAPSNDIGADELWDDR